MNRTPSRASFGGRVSFAALVLTLTLLLSALPGGAEERILGYESVVRVAPDASLEVTETLKVRAEGDQIRRGIYRDFPTRYRNAQGKRVRVPFDVLRVLLDGHPEDWHTEDRDNGVRLYAGSRDRTVVPGVHTYTLVYRTARQVGHFEGHDELYWNVTGNGWVFPIDRATCRILLPRKDGGTAPFLRQAAFTGAQGERGSGAIWRIGGDGSAFFETTRTLGPHEGLTVVASWPAGVVAPTEETRAGAEEGRGLILAGWALGGLTLLAFILAWVKVGRDPKKGTLVPRFAPPEGFSPAACRTLWRMGGFDSRTFACALIHGAVKGALTLVQEEDSFRLELRNRDLPGLASEEALLVRSFFPGDRGAFTFGDEEDETVRAAQDGVRRILKRGTEGTFFSSHRGWWALGVSLSLLAAGTLLMGEGGGDPGPLALGVGALALLGVTGVLIRNVPAAWRRFRESRGLRRGLSRLLGLVGAVLAVPAFLAADLVLLALLAEEGSPAAALMTTVLGAADALFFWLLKAPSVAGRKALDELEGFRMYLSVAEKDRMNLLNPPERTPELFERFLPYALALDVEQHWSEQFADVLARAAREPGGYTPLWYAGGSFDPTRPDRFASSLGDSLSSHIASAATPPGSESGFSGGSSGGGGGGGGGGGW